MCTFVIATLPTPDAITRLGGNHFGSVLLTPLNNPFLAPQLRPGETAFTTTSQFCDCGTFVGRGRLGCAAAKRNRKQEGKLRKSGWSEARIARWRDQVDADAARRVQLALDHQPDGFESWRSFIRTALCDRRLEFVGILHHTFRGDLSHEKIRVGDQLEVDLEALNADHLLLLEEDTVLRVAQ